MDARILMFSMNAEEVYAKRYLQLGAKGYLCKNASFEELGNGIVPQKLVKLFPGSGWKS